MNNMNKLPNCVGFIMDGNRRWATNQGLETLYGHQVGLLEKFSEVIRWVNDLNIENAVFYAFSTENWNRKENEVNYLMDLFRQQLAQMSTKTIEEKIRFRFIGRTTDFDQDIQDAMRELEEKTSQFTKTTVWVALSYGGRVEIVEAVNKAIEIGAVVNEESFSNLLWTAGMPDPDIIIRTGGEQRLSNFLPWQTVYSELFFVPTYWPAFTKEEFTRILSAYAERERRIGK